MARKNGWIENQKKVLTNWKSPLDSIPKDLNCLKLNNDIKEIFILETFNNYSLFAFYKLLIII